MGQEGIRIASKVAEGSDPPPPSRETHAIEVGGSDPNETAAIVAAVEQFLADTTRPSADDGPTVSPWARAALREGIDARQLWGDAPGHAPPPR